MILNIKTKPKMFIKRIVVKMTTISSLAAEDNFVSHWQCFNEVKLIKNEDFSKRTTKLIILSPHNSVSFLSFSSNNK